MIVETTREQMYANASFVASSLAPHAGLTKEKVLLTAEMLDISPEMRLIVCDAFARVLYDSAHEAPITERYLLLPEIGQALLANDVFFCEYRDHAFHSRLAMPIQYNSAPLGIVYLMQTDRTQAKVLESLRVQMRGLSLLICAILLLLVSLFSAHLSARFAKVLSGIRAVKEGPYGATVTISGNDELRLIADEFNQLSKRLEDTEALRQNFVSDASHELRTPLSAIRLLTDSILQSEQMDLETTREFMIDIGDEIDRLTRIAEKLLLLTKLDGAKSLEFTRVDFTGVTKQVFEALLPVANDADITLKCDLTEDLFLSADKDGLYQIVFNLVENAIKYNRPGGFVHLMLFAREGNVVLLVDDDGIGIPEEHRAHIFERFYRVDKARTRSGKGGTGLGLAIVYKNVTSYRGTIEVDCSPSGGTRFTVSFPQLTEGGDADA